MEFIFKQTKFGTTSHDAEVSIEEIVNTASVTTGDFINRDMPISYDVKPDFVVPYTCVRATPYVHDDYLLFHHKPPPFF